MAQDKPMMDVEAMREQLKELKDRLAEGGEEGMDELKEQIRRLEDSIRETAGEMNK